MENYWRVKKSRKKVAKTYFASTLTTKSIKRQWELESQMAFSPKKGWDLAQKQSASIEIKQQKPFNFFVLTNNQMAIKIIINHS